MREGPPRTTVRQARARQGVSRGRGPPDMGADHASHGAGVSTRGGRPSPRSADQYEGASMRAVGRFLANSLGYVASEHDYIGARPFIRICKGPLQTARGLLQGNRSAESEKIGTGEHQ